MKTYSFFTRVGNRLTQRLRRLSTERRGTVIIIVLVLLGLLTMIGFFAVTFTGQENQSATYFANSPTSKVLTTTTTADAFFDDILRQIIIGPSLNEKQSVLWGGNKALVPTMFGRDMAPYSGPGVNLVWNNTTNLPAIDQNYDGTPDTVTAGQPNLMQLNFSPAAQNQVIDFNSFSSDVTLYPDPDANLTYPDINNVFLASDTLVPNGAANAPVRVITPSFHRPMLLRNLAPSMQWYTSNTTARYVLFPHTAHLAIDNAGNVTTQFRFVTGINPDNSALGTPLVPYPIPGDPANAALTPPWSGGPAVQEGVWTAWSANTSYALSAAVIPIPPNGQVFQCTTAGTSAGTTPAWPTTTGQTVNDGGVTWTAIGPTNIGYDVDTDNDGIPDARYMDFGFPLMTDTSGNQFVAMGAIKIIDADSLFNLNVHGNRAALAQLPVNTNFAGGNNPAFLSLSDQGVSASEVNPEWALNARPLPASPDFPGTAPALTSALQQYTLLFRPGGSGSNPSNNFDSTAGSLSYELANMEMWNLLNGRPQLAPGTPPTVSGSSFVGRWGENTTRLDSNVLAILGGTTLSAGVSAPTDPFPLPGTSAFDDNNNYLEGGTFSDAQGIFHPAFIQPVDFFSAGNWVSGTQGKLRLLYPSTTQATSVGAEQFPQYSQFFIAPTVGWANVLGSVLVPGGSGKALIDEPDETWTEPSLAAQQTSDSIFGASENAIQLGGADYSNLGNPGRTASLMPFDFVSNARASLIRQRFTSTSWDVKSFGKEFLGPDTTAGAGPYDARRLWEFTDTSTGSTGAGPFRFPPNFVGSNGSLAPNLPLYTTISPYAAAIDDATTAASGKGTPSNPFAYPMRAAVSSLLQVLANPNLSSNPATGPYTVPYTPGGTLSLTNLVQPQRLLSVNGLTEVFQNGVDSNKNAIYQFRFRPLTPHPSTAVSTFANTPITPFPLSTQTSSLSGKTSSGTLPSVTWVAEPEQLTASNLAQQEWLARYDRQRMAHDIYTLLYLTGGGADTAGTSAINYAASSNQPIGSPAARPVYTDDQLAEMAQFAVNLVDALDPDSNITVFEYDKDLSDGWNLDDNAYDNGANDPITASHPNDRGVVYGVERQQLTLNEGMVLFMQQCVNSSGTGVQHPDFQLDTTKQWGFLSLELENVGPTPVTFQNQAWQIVIKQSPAPTLATSTTSPIPSVNYGNNPSTLYPSSGASGEMRLIFSSSQPSLPAGGGNGGTNPPPRLTIGGLVGSSDGRTYNVPNLNPSASPAAPYPSYVVIDPNDKDTVYQGTAYDNHTATPTVPVGFPIAPRAAYVSPTITPFPGTNPLNTDVFDLDLAAPSGSTTRNYANNYYVVPPGASGSPPAGASASFGDGQSVTSPVPTLGPGTQLLQFNDPITSRAINATTQINLRVELRRRCDLNRISPVIPTDATSESSNLVQALDNPWIVVDYMDIPVSKMVLTFNGNPADYSTQIQAQLGDVSSPGAVSTERTQPLYHDFQLNPVNTASVDPYPRNGGKNTRLAPLWQGNSLGTDNDMAGYNPGTQPVSPPTPPTIPPTIVTPTQITPHSLYQPHYDRDFTSIGELFNIPLYGPYGPQSPTSLTTGPSSGSSSSLSSGLTHLMASRTNESGAALGAETLVGADYVPADSLTAKQHYVGYGTAEFRFQHPEGGDQTQPNPATDFTENRWFRALGFLEVPTRSHRGVEEPTGVAPYQVAAGSMNGSLGFFRTPGKINLNTLRYPDIVAGLVGEPDIFNMNFTPALPSGLNLPSALSIPYLLQDITGDNVTNSPPQNPMPPTGTPAVRDWWEQFIATRDGVDPLPVGSGGTGLSIPGLPKSPSNATTSVTNYPANFPLGSHPYRGMNFSASGSVDTNGYNGTLESNALRSLPGDPVITGSGTFDLRRRLFELGTKTEHLGSTLDYATKQRLLSRLVGNTTTRSNVFFVWIQVDFFQAKDVGSSLPTPDTGVVRIGSKLGTSPGYRGFFVIDRSQALSLMAQQYVPTTTTGQPFIFSTNQSFNWQSLVLFRQRIQ